MSHVTHKVLDIRIDHNNETGEYVFYIPIRTGSLSIKIKHEDLPSDFCEFLDTALKTEVRRFGESPNFK